MISTSAGPSWERACSSAASSAPAWVTRTPSAPQSSAYSAKLGFVNDVSQTCHSPARCSLLIFPSSWLFKRTWVMFMPYFTAVVTSAMYCPNPPSPEIDTTGRPENARVLLGRRRPGTECRRECEADRAEIARHQNRLLLALEIAAETVGVVPDVDGNDGVAGDVAVQCRKDRCRAEALVGNVLFAPRLLLTPYVPTLGHFRSPVLEAGVAFETLSQEGSGHPDLSPHRNI